MNAPALAAALPLLALPYFAEVTAPWPQPCGGNGCYTNYAAMADLDGDGALDIILPNAQGYFSMGSPEPLVILMNDSSGNFSDASVSAVGGFTGHLRQVALGDVDGDGDLDVYAPDAWAGEDAFFVNDGGGIFTDEANVRLDEQSRAGAVRFGDLDGDGDLDLVIADWGPDPFGAGAISDANVYLNDGTGVFTEAPAAIPDVANPDGYTPVDVDLFDADGDFDLDILLDSHEESERLLLNDGSGVFADASATFPDGGNLSYGPAVCDVDGDGDLDVIIDNALGTLSEQILVNDGAGNFTDESSSRMPSETFDDNGVICVDIDADGDFDLLIPSLSGTERFLRNDGDGSFSAVAGGFPAVSDATLGMDLGDVNGDGILDAVTGQGETGSFVDRLYLGTADQPADTIAPGFRAIQHDESVPPGTTLRIRFAVFDSHVTDIGPRLDRAWLVYAIDAGAPVEVDAHFVGGDLFQAESAPMPATGAGSYRVCATDVRGNTACSAPDLAFTIAPGGDDDDDDDDGGGCGCRTTQTRPGVSTVTLLVSGAALGTILFVRRRGAESSRI